MNTIPQYAAALSDGHPVKVYFEEKKAEGGERFFNYYESNGWRVGKNQMRKWKAAASGWITRDGGAQGTSTEKLKLDWGDDDAQETAASSNN